MTNYQLDYASHRKQMYDAQSRIKKAERMIKLLSHYFGQDKLQELSLLDLGSSTGIIAHELSKNFKIVVGIDIDQEGINFAKKNFKKKNLKFQLADAMKLPFKNSSFDVVICAHVYEHVPNAKKLMAEIHRVLKPNGACYFAAVNALWPIEPHYNLPFLSYLPKNIAHHYVRLFGKADAYYESPRFKPGLKELTLKFKVIDYTDKILSSPSRYGFDDKIKGTRAIIAKVLAPLSKELAPTFFWLLVKEK